MLLASESVGFSKSGADIKEKEPVVSSIANLSLSADSPNDQVTVSSAVKLCTAVAFSTMDASLVISPASPDGPVITGAVTSNISFEPVVICSL